MFTEVSGRYFSISTVDTANVGTYTSLKLNDEGNPVISYHDDVNKILKLATCNDLNCTSPRLMIIDSTDDQYSSLQLDSVGNAVISYIDRFREVKLAVCSDTYCKLSVIAENKYYWKPSLQINNAGNSTVSYSYNTPGLIDNLEFLICNDVNCSSRIRATVGSTGDVSEYTPLQIGNTGNAVISYFDFEGDLTLAVCNDFTCSSSQITTVDFTGYGPSHSSLQLNSAGYAVISYRDYKNKDLKLAVCNDLTCSSPVITSLVTDVYVGIYTSLKLDHKNHAVISYYDRTNGKLKLAVCNDLTCSSPSLITIASTNDQCSSLQLNGVGHAVISYHDTNKYLKLAVILVNSAHISLTTNSSMDLMASSWQKKEDNLLTIVGFGLCICSIVMYKICQKHKKGIKKGEKVLFLTQNNTYKNK